MSISVVQLDSYKKVIDLYKIVYPGKDLDKFEWLYNKNPNGTADIFGAIDEESGNVVGTYAFIPMKMVINDRIAKVAQAIDGMVHPDFRGKRVFNKLVAEVFPKVSGKYDYLIGFPNNNSRGSLVKAGWIELGEFVTYSLPLTAKAITNSKAGSLLTPVLFLYNSFHRLKYSRPDDSLEVNSSDIFLYDRILTNIQQKNKIMVYRDSELISWRFCTIPKKNYQVLRFFTNGTEDGYIAYKTNNNTAEIVDLIIDPKETKICSAISLFVDYCIKKTYSAIHVQLSNNTYCREALKNIGFIKRKTNHAIIIYPTQENLQQISFTDCYISLADTDWL